MMLPLQFIGFFQEELRRGEGDRSHPLNNGSSPSRVGNFGLISYRVEHAGEDFEAQVLLIA
jgi:hypothetical protein